MRCQACSAENPDGNSFCESCGACLGMACLLCGYRNSPTARFCGSCGSALGTTDAELKYATVMFADIVGSTALITGIGPEQAKERYNQWLRLRALSLHFPTEGPAVAGLL